MTIRLDKPTCSIPNCGRTAPADDALCSRHRRETAWEPLSPSCGSRNCLGRGGTCFPDPCARYVERITKARNTAKLLRKLDEVANANGAVQTMEPVCRTLDECADAISSLLTPAPETTPPPSVGEGGATAEPTEHKASEQMISELCEALERIKHECDPDDPEWLDQAAGRQHIYEICRAYLARAQARGAAR